MPLVLVNLDCSTAEEPGAVGKFHIFYFAHRSGSDGSMYASGSVGPGIDPQQGGKFSTSGLGGVEMYTF